MSQMKLPYEFQDKDRKIVFHRHDLPQPWINYLSNGKMHAFVSQAGGGMCWWRTPMNCRITRYRFYNMPIDSPGFYIYIRMKNGTVWSPTFRPCETAPDQWHGAHSPGYSRFTAEKDGLQAVLTLFVAPDSDTLVWDLVLSNQSGEMLECDVFAYTEFSQLVFENETKLGYYLKWNVNNTYNEELDAILYLYTSWVQVDVKNAPVVYFATSDKADSFCCNRDSFCGNYRDERDPVQVQQGKLSNTNMVGGEPCGALHHHVKLNIGEGKQLTYFLGVTPGALIDYEAARQETAKTLQFLKSEGEVERQFQKNINWWNDHLNIYQCEIPNADAMRQVNTWNPMQSVVTARFSRSISSSASGIRGVGFRDSAQDMLAQAYRKPEWAKEMLYYLASQQFEDGHAAHTCWPEDGKPAQDITRSDDHIWLVYLTYAIAAETGDISFLNTQLPFLDKDLRSPVGSAALWEHLLRGVEFTEKHKGEHGLPLILFSDWNDHLGPFGRKGKGESIFVSQQHIYGLKQLTELAKLRGEHELVSHFADLIAQQENALERYAWDGNWYIRGIDDDGNPVGSEKSEYAKIWVNSQSWMVIAGAGDREKHLRAMDSVKEYMDTGMGLLINMPGLPAEKANNLPAGYSENGGIFCQANCWAIIAEALLGRGENAWKYYTQLIPHEVIKRIGLEAYRGEAYAYSSTMLGPDNEMFGQACVSQVTGTAAWMDVAVTQYLLGVRPTLQGLLIDPSIPADWTEYRVTRVYRGCRLNILVKNPNGVQHGVSCISIDGTPINGNMITPDVLWDKQHAEVIVTMG